jgi:hypothetical protein
MPQENTTFANITKQQPVLISKACNANTHGQTDKQAGNPTAGKSTAAKKTT